MSVQKKPRVRVSKNRKKAWNKYCDIKEIEDYLEEKRFNERIGGAVSEKSDAEVFFIQTEGEDKGKLPPKQKQLKCFQNIGSYSKVPPPYKRSNVPYSKKIKKVLTRADDKIAKNLKKYTPKEKNNGGETLQVGDMFCAELKDLWVEEKIDPEIGYLVKFRDEITRERRPNIPAHRFQKPSLLPSVEVPHAGASYNPSYDDHQDLLHEALVIEEAKQKEEFHLKRVLTDMFPTKANAPTQESVLKEMSQGLFDDEEDSEENETENTLFIANPPVSSEDRIPKSRKRRKKERKEQERLKHLEKIQKKELNEVYRLRSIKNEIKVKDEITKGKIETRLQKRIDRMYNPQTLGKYKYEAPDVEIKLSEELSGSLRTLKCEGNLLEDRYKSLQRRNIIEPRIKQKLKRKYKLKVQVKRSHRDFK